VSDHLLPPMPQTCQITVKISQTFLQLGQNKARNKKKMFTNATHDDIEKLLLVLDM